MNVFGACLQHQNKTNKQRLIYPQRHNKSPWIQMHAPTKIRVFGPPKESELVIFVVMAMWHVGIFSNLQMAQCAAVLTLVEHALVQLTSVLLGINWNLACVQNAPTGITKMKMANVCRTIQPMPTPKLYQFVRTKNFRRIGKLQIPILALHFAKNVHKNKIVSTKAAFSAIIYADAVPAMLTICHR